MYRYANISLTSFVKIIGNVSNGIGWDDKVEEDGCIHDDYRIEYLRQNIQSMKDAVTLDGVDLMGYTMWGCIDLVRIASNGKLDNALPSEHLNKTACSATPPLPEADPPDHWYNHRPAGKPSRTGNVLIFLKNTQRLFSKDIMGK